MDDITLLRKRIGDNPKTNSEVFTIDASTTSVVLSFSNCAITSIFDKEYADNSLVDEEDYIIDPLTGTLSLLYDHDESQITVNYHYYAFTDDELNDLLDAYGLNGATVEAIRWLIADASRLHDYSQGATSESLNQIVKNLRDMIEDYKALGDPTNPATKITKRTNEYYRGSTNINYDLSRDDSLNY